MMRNIYTCPIYKDRGYIVYFSVISLQDSLRLVIPMVTEITRVKKDGYFLVISRYKTGIFIK